MKILLKYLEVPVLIAVPAILVACALLRFSHTALLSLVVVLAAFIVFFARFELSKPSLRQIMPIIVMGALAAAGRILFAPFPDFKPVTAICIVSGIMFGRHAGFITGALAALISNFFFGHGPWTPWQMYAWGMIGYFAGVIATTGVFGRESKTFAANPRTVATDEPRPKHQFLLLSFGALAAFFYGFILNTWTIVGFIQPLTWQTALIAYTAGLPFDITHAIATITFLAIIMVPWHKKLVRIKRKYAITD